MRSTSSCPTCSTLVGVNRLLPSITRSALNPSVGLLIAVTAAILANTGGCGRRPITPSRAPAAVSGDWPFAPTQILVHPLSRYWVTTSHGKEVEARIQLLDADGFPTRGIGRLELTLTSPNGRSIETWVLQLNNLDTNRAHFDNVTRTYLVRLSLPNQDVPDRAELEAKLVLPTGREITDYGKVSAAPADRSDSTN